MALYNGQLLESKWRRLEKLFSIGLFMELHYIMYLSNT